MQSSNVVPSEMPSQENGSDWGKFTGYDDAAGFLSAARQEYRDEKEFESPKKLKVACQIAGFANGESALFTQLNTSFSLETENGGGFRNDVGVSDPSRWS